MFKLCKWTALNWGDDWWIFVLDGTYELIYKHKIYRIHVKCTQNGKAKHWFPLNWRKCSIFLWRRTKLNIRWFLVRFFISLTLPSTSGSIWNHIMENYSFYIPSAYEMSPVTYNFNQFYLRKWIVPWKCHVFWIIMWHSSRGRCLEKEGRCSERIKNVTQYLFPVQFNAFRITEILQSLNEYGWRINSKLESR